MDIFSEKPNVTFINIITSLCFAVAWWTSSCTILLPLVIALKLSCNFRKYYFSIFFVHVLKFIVGLVAPIRKKLFELLPSNIENFKLLEVGVGPGMNFEYYPEHCKITLLDMNQHFDTEIRKRLKEFPHLKVEQIILSSVDNMESIPDSTYDLVLCTHLLCSVDNVDSALKEIRRVLKPGGNFMYMEHIAFPKWHLAYWIQFFISPIWKIYFNGCTITKSTHTFIDTFFSKNSYKFVYSPKMPVYFRPHIIGIATKL